MAAGTTMAITSALGLGLSAYQGIKGASDRRRAQKMLDNYERQDISPGTSPYENVQLSTVGTDLLREESQRSASNAFNIMSNAGSRAIIGGVPRIVSTSNNVNREIQRQLDEQNQKRQYAIAGDESAMRSMREQRDYQNINALSSQINAGQQMFYDGLMGGASAISSFGRYLTFRDTEDNKEDNQV